MALEAHPQRVTSCRCYQRQKSSCELAGWAGEVPALLSPLPACSPILTLKPFLLLSWMGLLPSHPSQTHKPGPHMCWEGKKKEN